jgi:hypothetical protein
MLVYLVCPQAVGPSVGIVTQVAAISRSFVLGAPVAGQTASLGGLIVTLVTTILDTFVPGLLVLDEAILLGKFRFTLVAVKPHTVMLDLFM